mmetsp:Transcript_7680/g.21368  ORF Transcript_7680/g.21368 Transcript_7680/m.21368 type:complete len:226 (-) Transcript_7680:1136-1813(-)
MMPAWMTNTSNHSTNNWMNGRPWKMELMKRMRTTTMMRHPMHGCIPTNPGIIGEKNSDNKKKKRPRQQLRRVMQRRRVSILMPAPIPSCLTATVKKTRRNCSAWNKKHWIAWPKFNCAVPAWIAPPRVPTPRHFLTANPIPSKDMIACGCRPLTMFVSKIWWASFAITVCNLPITLATGKTVAWKIPVWRRLKTLRPTRHGKFTISPGCPVLRAERRLKLNPFPL